MDCGGNSPSINYAPHTSQIISSISSSSSSSSSIESTGWAEESQGRVLRWALANMPIKLTGYSACKGKISRPSQEGLR